MDSLMIFNNPEFGDIRTHTEPNGTVLFRGLDVAGMLGYAAPRNVIAKYCPCASIRCVGVRTGTRTDGEPIIQQKDMTFITEGDVYRLMYKAADQSRNSDIKEKAKRFGEWIFDEVLPQISRTGTYSIQKPMTQAEIIAAQAQLLVDMERRVDQVETMLLDVGTKTEAVEQKLDRALAVYSQPSADHWKADMDAAIVKMTEDYQQSSGWFRWRLYKELEDVAKVNIDTRLTRLRERVRKQGMTFRESQTLTKLDAISKDSKLRPIFEGIIKKYQARGGVKKNLETINN